MAKKEVKAVKAVHLSEYIRYVIADICKSNLKEKEIIVLVTYVDSQIIVSVYPKNANYESAVKLLTTSLMQTQTAWKIRKEEEEDKRAKVVRKQYTM